MNASSIEYEVENSKREKITVIIEPWAEEFELSPGSKLLLIASFVRPGRLVIDSSEAYLTLWVWSTCTARVFVNGEERTTPFMSEVIPG